MGKVMGKNKRPPVAPMDPKDIAEVTRQREAERQRKILEISPYARLEIPAGEKPDILAYLVGQPDVNIVLAPLPEEEVAQETEKTEDQKKSESLAELIRSRTRLLQITPYALLQNEDNNVAEALEMLKKDESFNDITAAKGEKDTYYYSAKTMTKQYATIAILVEEENHLRTVAHMVRYHCELYPSPTPISYFLNHPYYYSKPFMEQVMEALKNGPEYEDILEVTNANGNVYLYSTKSMSQRYAAALADRAEVES